MIDHIFGPTAGNIGFWQELARVAVVFVFGTVLFRLSGRRTFARWSAADTVVAVIVGSALSRALTGNAPFFGTLAASALFVLLHWLLSHAVARSRVFSKVFEGGPIPLGKHGRIDMPTLRRHAISDADLSAALRGRGLSTLDDGKVVTLEPSGKITVAAEPPPKRERVGSSRARSGSHA